MKKGSDEKQRDDKAEKSSNGSVADLQNELSWFRQTWKKELQQIDTPNPNTTTTTTPAEKQQVNID